MTTAAMLIKEIETLPEESVKEALNFVLFLQSRKKSILGGFSEMNAAVEQRRKDKFPGMNKPIRLGFDFKKISREELYER